MQQASPATVNHVLSCGRLHPDGDTVTFQWWFYKEAGTYAENVIIANPRGHTSHVNVPADAGGKEIHLILEVLDKHQEIGMYDYRRVVLEVL